MITTTNYADHFYAKSGNDIAALEKQVNDHPVSSLSQFLLLYHYKKNKDQQFEKLAKQTVLYFNNPNWLHFQLAKSDLEKEEADHFEVISAEEKNEVSTNEVEELVPVESKHEIIESKDSIEKNDLLVIENPVTENEEIIPVETKSNHSQTDNLPAEIEKNEIIPFESKEENIVKLSAAEENSLLAVNEPVEEPVAFEPLHTVDYFASQGIKIKEENLANDKLGKQVKSFTDWLKSMKKLHPGKLPEQNEAIEKIIQSSAEESNADAEVLTEAMAEVLIKQDKKEKAIEMYQKLSLMDPSKSAYFAGKIESIKTY